MMRNARVFVAFLSLFLVLSRSIQAAEFEPNNKVGIHMSSYSDENTRDACALVNSSGGAWGYTTVVLQINDLSHDKWQAMFDHFRECKLIPIVRIATEPVGESWRAFTESDVEKVVSFLDDLNWPIEAQYVMPGNEPNHCRETGGVCDPEKHATITKLFAKRFHESKGKFFVITAGLDQAAPNGSETMDAAVFLKRMLAAEPDYFDHFDGLSSHSYPNPAFSGSVYDRGRGSIRGYEWELALLKSLGVEKELPVFITETGWDQVRLSPDRVAQNYRTAYESIWLADSRVRAVTPFDLHIGPPFCHFSWKHCDTGAFNGNFLTISEIDKPAGNPTQRQKASIIATCPTRLVQGSSYNCQIWLKNGGQAIWDKRDGYRLDLLDHSVQYRFSDMYSVRPKAATVSNFSFGPGDKLGKNKLTIGLFKDEKLVLELFSLEIEVFERPSLNFSVSSFPDFSPSAENFELQIFNKDQDVVFKKENARIVDGVGRIEAVPNISLNECHRIVLLRPGYLPVQQPCVRFLTGDNSVEFPQMIKVDRNGDGKLSFADLF